jgi:membrane protease YdiL (CAAX protease family)
MRKFGKIDLLYLIFFADMTLLMLYGMGMLVDLLYKNGGIIVSNKIVNDLFLYFYYPPKGVFAFLFPIPFFIGVAVLFLVYIYIFYYNYKTTEKDRGMTPLQTSIGYIAGVGALIYFLSIILVLVQDSLGVPISSSGLTSIESTEPVFFYYQLIYAPFIEELEFRIIPIGAYLVIRYWLEKKDFKIWQAFLIPGMLMKKFRRRLDKYDWSMILITSLLFGFAHYAYGDWSLSKIPQAAMGGFAFAIGFMLFGPFVDIPMHFLFDGTLTVEILPGAIFAYPLIVAGVILLFACAIVTIILLIINWNKRKQTQPEESQVNDP